MDNILKAFFKSINLKATAFILIGLFFNNNVAAQSEITINKLNGVFKIPCKVNGLSLDFIFDTGASDVSISITEAMFLLKQGLINSDDFVGEKKYTIANGTIEKGSVINIREVEVEGIVLKNVKATVFNNVEAPLIMGMSAISKLGKVELFEDKLVITEGAKDNMQTTKEKDFAIFYEKATNAIFQVFQTLTDSKVDNYIKSNYKLFVAPRTDEDELTSGFNNINQDSITIAEDIKSFFKHFPINTKQKNIDWKLLNFNDFSLVSRVTTSLLRFDTKILFTY